MDRDRLAGILAEYREGYSLPQPFYVDPALHDVDVAAVFETEWLFAGSACEIKRPGDYLTLEIGRNSVVILRDRDGAVRAFHNTCRHRGSRICGNEKGRANRLVCPYHQWVYELDGSLLHARQMPADFDRSQFGLVPVAVETVCGMIYVCLADNPPDFKAFRDALTPYIAPHMPERTKVAFEMTLIEDANWKLVIENNRECYHCSANHPELLVSLVEFTPQEGNTNAAQFAGLVARKAAAWESLGVPHRLVNGGRDFRFVRLPFHEGKLSFTLDGAPACRKLLGELVEPDLGSVRMFHVPNNWNHFVADHILHFRVLPLSADRTAVRTTWLVHEDAVEGVDYDIKRLTEVWIATNAQDADLAANNHRGIRSSAYRPGPYAPTEFMLTSFTNWYADKIREFAGAPSPLRVAAQ
ncbi:MAG: aromatic ring-hydroxylating dioxygenase subunit alpha [Proteobacteria bacterium]|nr:aromatic ring-hydroxylating dioxygenase subunit alpha [Pseudomonadota bacterium]